MSSSPCSDSLAMIIDRYRGFFVESLRPASAPVSGLWKTSAGMRSVVIFYVTKSRRRVSSNHHRNHHRSIHRCDDSKARELVYMSCILEGVVAHIVSSVVYRVGFAAHKDDTQCAVKRAVVWRASTSKAVSFKVFKQTGRAQALIRIRSNIHELVKNCLFGISRITNERDIEVAMSCMA